MHMNVTYKSVWLSDLEQEGCDFSSLPIELRLTEKQHGKMGGRFKLPVPFMSAGVIVTWSYRYNNFVTYVYMLDNIELEEKLL